jgi:glycosyltransferase involved in cell wall biosynthesis
MSRLTVLFITPWYPTKEIPAGMFVQEFARAVHLYNDVVVLHHAGKRKDLKKVWHVEPENDSSITKGIPTYRFWYRESPVPQTSFMFFGLWSLLQAFRYIVRQGYLPDIIHVHVYAFGALAIFLKKLYAIPVVITEHSSSILQKNLNLRQKFLAQFAFQRADAVLPVSQSLRQAVENYGVNKYCQVVPNVVDTQLFKPDQLIPPKEKTKQVLFVGRLDSCQKKGILYLLRALAQLRQKRNDWQLDIVGDGAARPKYEQMAEDLGIYRKVAFHGHKFKDDVAQFMRQCDFFVLPSLTETFSVVLIEALSCGKPVITTYSGGPEEFVTKDVGLLVEPGDTLALMQAIDHMLDHYTEYSPEQLANYVRQRFSYEIVGRILDNVYRDTYARNKRK